MEQLINNLYRVFQPYHLGSDFTGCSHCVDPARTEWLASKPLRNLALPDLDLYSFNAMTTWGDLKHFKHFLPRLLELASTDFNGFLSAEVLFGKLAYGNWHDWPEAERSAVDAFLREFWQSVISSDPTSLEDDSIDTALCALGNACSTTAPFLRQWTAADAPGFPNQLAHFVLLNVHEITEHRRLTNPFWEGRPVQAREVIEWLRLPTTYEYLYDRRDGLDARLSESVAALASL